MKRKISILLVVCLLCGLFLLPGCKTSKDVLKLEKQSLIHEPEFGGIYITSTIDEFNQLGFQYGDSVDIVFSNGYTLKDLPYYNGYYTSNGEPLLVAYPGYDYIKAAINNGDDLWVVAGLEENMTATITLNTAGKFLSIQKARDIHYTDDRSKYDSDEIFANFRAMNVGNLKKDTVFRSASPCDNQHNRAGYVDTLMEAAGVQFILNLSDTTEKIQKYLAKEDFNSPAFLKLYEEGRVNPIGLNMNYGSDDFKAKIVNGFTVMSEYEGPYLIHCTEGKDRTGFVCMLLEALSGASYQEIKDDYMTTYYNYYKINEETDKERYDVIVDKVLNPMISSMVNDASVDITKDPLQPYAEKFLLDGGMSQEVLDALKAKIMN